MFYRGVYLLSESDGVEFVLDSPVEAFTDAVCLRALGLDLGMVDVLDGQIQFVFMCFPVSAVFGSPVREHPHQFQVMLLEERNHPVIEHVRRHERVLPVVKFGESDFGIGVDDRLLVNVPHTFDIPYIIGVLRHKEAWIISLYFPVCLFLRLGFFQRGHLVLVKHDAFLLHLGRKCLQAFLEGLHVMPEPDGAHSSGRYEYAFLAQLVGYAYLSQSRVVYGHLHYSLLYALLHAVLYHRLFTGNLLQGQFSALLVQFLETIKTVTAVSHDLAGS